MIRPLPAETVFEAKQRTRRATTGLLALLVAIYTVFANLIILIGLAALRYQDIFEASAQGKDNFLVTDFWPILCWSTSISFFVAVIHFWIARSKSVEKILSGIGAETADPQDDYHRSFINIVEEAQVALGGKPVQAVVLPIVGANAFSIEDGKGNAAIGVTEGLLGKLDRSELTAVVAHEAAHLAHEDSKLVTTTCCLFTIFEILHDALEESISKGSEISINGRRNFPVFSLLVQIILWLIVTTGYFLSKLTYMAISRKREYYADADAVHMCQDPLSLAEALYKISRGYRGNSDLGRSFSAIYILNPEHSGLDEEENWFADLFSTHPPVGRRLQKLLRWANANLSALETREKESKKSTGPSSPPQFDQDFFVHHDGIWKGPYTPTQMLVMGLVTPTSMVRESGTDQMMRASDHPLFLPSFQDQVTQTVAKSKCPRCKVSLIETHYEGAPVMHCSFCKGYLLKWDVLERIIARKEQEFSENQIEQAIKWWRAVQKKSFDPKLDGFPLIKCPLCESQMIKTFHTYHTRVYVDRCLGPACGAIWCDKGELETIQILIDHTDKLI